jgi:hypothetical protein
MTAAGITHGLLHFNLGENEIVSARRNHFFRSAARAARIRAGRRKRRLAVKAPGHRLYFLYFKDSVLCQSVFAGKHFEAEGKGIDDNPRQAADVNPDRDDFPGSVLRGELLQLFDQALGQGELMHRRPDFLG